MTAIANPIMVAVVRHSKGWTQSQLAKAAGFTQGFISKVESGDTTLRGKSLEAVAAALECLPELLAYDRPVEALQITCLHAPSARSPLRASCDRPTAPATETGEA